MKSHSVGANLLGFSEDHLPVTFCMVEEKADDKPPPLPPILPLPAPVLLYLILFYPLLALPPSITIHLSWELHLPAQICLPKEVPPDTVLFKLQHTGFGGM